MRRTVLAVSAAFILSACQQDLNKFVDQAADQAKDLPSHQAPPPAGSHSVTATSSVSSGSATATSPNLGMSARLAPRDKRVTGAQVGMTVRLTAHR